MVEFGLVLPILLVLLLGIADLGRVFASAIATESAAREGAEAAALEYLQLDQRDGLSTGTLTAADYQALHDTAFVVACREAERLPDRIFDDSDMDGVLDDSENCVMPIIGVCVHDLAAGDPSCPQTSATYPANCDQMGGGWAAAAQGDADTPWIEVRICYRFDLLISAPLGDWGSIWLQRENYFTVANW